MNNILKIKIFFLVFLLLFTFQSKGQNVTLSISKLQNTEGQLLVAVFETKKQFKQEEPVQTIKIDKSNIKKGKKVLALDLKPDTYAITILDDEDMFGDMSFRFGIYPLEGVGFSNYVLKKLNKPNFSDFSFIKTNEDLKIKVKMRYF